MLIAAAGSSQQFRYDNVKYQTVFLEDLCKTLKENKGYTLLDVRSNGEYFDSSTSSPSLNIGRLKNVQHINISELGARWRELENLKDKPLFIYCSHSQRSRRAARMLADSGFTRIFNINGGLTDIIMEKSQLPSCLTEMYTSNLPYKVLSPGEVMAKAGKTNPFYIIDLRPDSLYKGISLHEKRNIMGRLEGAHPVLFSELEGQLPKIPHDQPLLLVDEAGNESPGAALLLSNLGFTNIHILFNGMDAWMDEEINHGNKSVIKWISHPAYHIISADQFDKMMKTGSPLVIDLRSVDQFSNQSKNYWENIGKIRNAVNIPYTGFTNTVNLPSSKETAIVLYSFNNQNEVYEAARELTGKGYKNVNVLRGGIWNLRWAAHNIKGKAFLNEWVVDVPEQNL